MLVLVDTPIWSLALRRKQADLNAHEAALVSELADLIREHRACIVGAVRQELLSGVRGDAQFQVLRRSLRAFRDEPVTTDDYEEAARTFNVCRKSGVSASAVDALLCAVAIRRSWQVFTLDKDFLAYGKLLPLHLHPAH